MFQKHIHAEYDFTFYINYIPVGLWQQECLADVFLTMATPPTQM